MIKFFREYSRTLILVIMSLLLIVFLVDPSVIRRSSGRGPGPVIGTAFGEPVHYADMRGGAIDIRLFRMLNMRFPMGEGESDEEGLSAWLMLEEARRAGIRFDRPHIEAQLRDMRVTDEQLETVRQIQERTLRSIFDSVGALQASLLLAQIQLASLGPSEPRLLAAYREQNQRADVEVAVIDAISLLPTIPQPTEEELAAFFEECKDRNPAHTPEALVFGYRLPPRVRLEYLTVDPDDIVARVTVSSREARTHYEQNREHYQRTLAAELGGGPLPDLDALPDALRDRVRSAARAEKAVLEAQKLVNQMQQEAVRAGWEGAARDEQGFRIPPPAERIVSFEEMRQRYSEQYPVRHDMTDLVTFADLNNDPGLGAARVRFGRVEGSVSQFAARVKGLYDPAPNEPAPVLNLFEPSDVCMRYRIDMLSPRREGRPHQAYVFRVVEAVPAGPPASVDEVREQATRDWRVLKAFELAGAHAERIAARAREVGLEAAIAEETELRELLRQAEAASINENEDDRRRHYLLYTSYGGHAFGRMPAVMPGHGMEPDLHERIFEFVDSPPESGRPVALVGSAQRRRFVLGELLGVRPLYEEDFAAARSTLRSQMQMGEAFQALQLWWSPEYLRMRAHFVPARVPLE